MATKPNINPENIGAGLGELKSRLLFLLFAIFVYRIGTHIPVPGIDPLQLAAFFAQQEGTFTDMINMFGGGALERMSIVALGIMPYISASIIMQLLTAVSPHLDQLKKEGESGRRKISQYTRYGALGLATIQGTGMAVGLLAPMAYNPGVAFTVTAVVSLVTGAMFMMWLGEQITARGIGNGISLIIFVGIIAEVPAALAQFFSQGRSGAISPAVLIAVILMVVGTIMFVVFMERALRKIHIQYPRRQVGMKMYDGGSSHLPVKVNPAGVIPAIFASSLLLLPTTISTFSAQGSTGPVMSWLLAFFGPGEPLYLLFFAGMIVFFAYFYTFNVSFKPDEVADNLKNQSGFVPGVRPGKKTAEYLEYVVNRILVLGAAYLAAVCLLPEFLRGQFTIPFYFGGTSVLIVVSVTMDTIQQVQSHLLAHQYEGLIERSQLSGKGRKRKRKGTTRR